MRGHAGERGAREARYRDTQGEREIERGRERERESAGFGLVAKIPGGLGTTKVFPSYLNSYYGVTVDLKVDTSGNNIKVPFYGCGDCSPPSTSLTTPNTTYAGWMDPGLNSANNGPVTYSDTFVNVNSIWVSSSGNLYISDGVQYGGGWQYR